MGLTQAQRRARQRQAGLDRIGPREAPKTDAEASDAGYRVPPDRRYKHPRNVKRNQAIVAKVDAAKPHNRAKVIEGLAEKYGLAFKSVEHIARYFQTPEE